MPTRRQKAAAAVAVLAVFVVPGVIESVFGETVGVVTFAVIAGGIVVAVVGAGLAGATYSMTALRLGFGLRDRDADTTVDIDDGDPVYIEGVAKPHRQTMSAPFSGEECLAYTWAIERRETRTQTEQMSEGQIDGQMQTVWRDVVDDREVVPFELDAGAGGGTVLVLGDGLTPLLDDDETEIVVGPDEMPPDRVQAFLEDPALAAPDGDPAEIPSYDRDGTVRYRETLLRPDEACFVMGEGASAHAAELGPGMEVDAVVGPPSRDGYIDWVVDQIPDKLYPFDFSVADTPMDETLRGLRWGGAMVLVMSLVAFGFVGLVVWVGVVAVFGSPL